MVSHDETLPRKEPTQERSRALVTALIEATARILSADGPEAITTNRVAEVAGVSIGSLYQYFPNKEALLAALVERELQQDISQVRTLFEHHANLPLSELIRHFSSEIIATTFQRRDLHTRLLPLIDQVHRVELVRREREELSSLFEHLLATRFDELPPRLTQGPDAAAKLRTASFLAMRAMELGFNALKVEAPDLLERPELPDLLTRIFDALLLQD